MTEYIGKDEKTLKAMLDESLDFEERRKIRAAMRDLRNKRFSTVTVTSPICLQPTKQQSNQQNSHRANEWGNQRPVNGHQPRPAGFAAQKGHEQEVTSHAAVTERIGGLQRSQSHRIIRIGDPSPIDTKAAAKSFLNFQLCRSAMPVGDNRTSVGDNRDATRQREPVIKSTEHTIKRHEPVNGTVQSSHVQRLTRSETSASQPTLLQLSSTAPAKATEHQEPVLQEEKRDKQERIKRPGVISKPVGRSQSVKLLASKFESSHTGPPPLLNTAYGHVATENKKTSVKVGRASSMRLVTRKDEQLDTGVGKASAQITVKQSVANGDLGGSEGNLARKAITRHHSLRNTSSTNPVGPKSFSNDRMCSSMNSSSSSIDFKAERDLGSQESVSNSHRSMGSQEIVSQPARPIGSQENVSNISGNNCMSSLYIKPQLDVGNGSVSVATRTAVVDPPQGIPNGLPSRFKHPAKLRNGDFLPVMKSASFSSFGKVVAVDLSEPMVTQTRDQIKASDLLKGRQTGPIKSAHALVQDQDTPLHTRSQENLEKDMEMSLKRHEIIVRDKHSGLKAQPKRPQSAGEMMTSAETTPQVITSMTVNPELVTSSGITPEVLTSLQKYDDIADERQLQTMLQECTELEERIQIRAALRKLKQRQLSEPQNVTAMQTTLQQNKQHLLDLFNHSASQPTNQSTDYTPDQTTSQASNQSQTLSPNTSLTSEGGLNSSVGSDAAEYAHIKDQGQLQNLLNQTEDYFERKKIRTALTALKRRNSLAEIEHQKRKNSLRRSCSEVGIETSPDFHSNQRSPALRSPIGDKSLIGAANVSNSLSTSTLSDDVFKTTPGGEKLSAANDHGVTREPSADGPRGEQTAIFSERLTDQTSLSDSAYHSKPHLNHHSSNNQNRDILQNPAAFENHTEQEVIAHLQPVESVLDNRNLAANHLESRTKVSLDINSVIQSPAAAVYKSGTEVSELGGAGEGIGISQGQASGSVISTALAPDNIHDSTPVGTSAASVDEIAVAGERSSANDAKPNLHKQKSGHERQSKQVCHVNNHTVDEQQYTASTVQNMPASAAAAKKSEKQQFDQQHTRIVHADLHSSASDSQANTDTVIVSKVSYENLKCDINSDINSSSIPEQKSGHISNNSEAFTKHSEETDIIPDSNCEQTSDYSEVLLRKTPGRRLPKTPQNKAYSTSHVTDNSASKHAASMDYQQSMVIPPHMVDINANSEKPALHEKGTRNDKHKSKRKATHDVNKNVKSAGSRDAQKLDNVDTAGECRELPLLSELNENIKQLQAQLEESSDFDERRTIRRQIRDARTAIKDGMYRKDTDRQKKQSPTQPSNQPNIQPHTQPDTSSDIHNQANLNNIEEPIIISPGEVKVQQPLHLETIEKSETVVQSKPTESFQRQNSKRKIHESKIRRNKLSSSDKSVDRKSEAENHHRISDTENKNKSKQKSESSVNSVPNSNVNLETNLKADVVTSSLTEKPKADSVLLLDLSEIKAADDSSGDLIGRNEFDDGFLGESEIDGHILEENSDSKKERQIASTPRELLAEKEKNLTYKICDEEKTTIEDDEPERPEILQHLSDCIGIDGETVHMRCRTTPYPGAKIQWFQGSREIKPSAEFRQTFDGELSEMEITQVFPDDEGEYSCHVTCGEELLTTKCYLLVKENKAAILPKFSRGLADTRAEEGSKLVLSCEVSSVPAPRIYWYYSSIMIKKSNPELLQAYDGRAATLSIDRVVLEDSGEYTCAAKNTAGEVRCSCVLAVSPKDEAESNNTLEAEQEPEMMNEQEPEPNIAQIENISPESSEPLNSKPSKITEKKETKAHAPIAHEEDLDDHVDEQPKVNHIDEIDAKEIKDQQEKEMLKLNEPEVVTTEVQDESDDESEEEGEAPEVSMVSSELVLAEGDTMTLTCHVTGRPQPTVVWKRDDEELVETKNVRMELEGGVASLTVTSVAPAHEGTYECAAQSWAGSAGVTASVSVKAKPKPKVIANSEPIEIPKITKALPEVTEISLDTYFCLQCHFLSHSNKTQVAWFKDGIELPKVGRMKWSYERAYTKLWIHHASRGDVGTFKVVITNTAGHTRCSTRVKLKEAPLTDLTPVRKKLQPKQVDEKASHLLGNVLNNLMSTEKEGERGQLKKIYSHYQPAAAAEKTTTASSRQPTKQKPIIMTDKDVDRVDDEELLYKMLNQTENFDDRKRIRARLRTIREQKTAEYEAKRKEREAQREDAVKLKHRQAEEEKQRKQKQYQEIAKQPKANGQTDFVKERQAKAEAEKTRKLQQFDELAKSSSQAYQSGSDVTARLDQQKARELRDKRMADTSNEDTVSRSTKTQSGPGGSTTTTVTTTTHKTQDGSTAVTKQTKQVTQVSKTGGTSYSINKSSADKIAQNVSKTLAKAANVETSGVITVKTEEWSSKDGITKRNEKTKAWGGGPASKAKSGPRGAMAAFQQMDNSNPKPKLLNTAILALLGDDEDFESKITGTGRVAVQRSPSTIKQIMLDWCAKQVQGYENVNITNFSSSWNDGMAFCALIHHFHPEAFDFSKLDPKKRRANFALAFHVAEKYADIAPLLDVDDMVRMKNPDWKCVFTYVQSFYRKFNAPPQAKKD